MWYCLLNSISVVPTSSSVTKTVLTTRLFPSREKEALMRYLKSVERALELSKDQVRLSKGAVGSYEYSLPQLILTDERLTLDGLSLGPELLTCQVVYET